MGKKIIILSLVFAVAGYFLGVIAEAARDTGMAIYYASCGGKILCFLIAVLFAHHTGKTIRRKLNVIGLPGLRYISWIMYGVAMVHFMLFFRWDLISAGNTPTPRWTDKYRCCDFLYSIDAYDCRSVDHIQKKRLRFTYESSIDTKIYHQGRIKTENSEQPNQQTKFNSIYHSHLCTVLGITWNHRIDYLPESFNSNSDYHDKCLCLGSHFCCLDFI